MNAKRLECETPVSLSLFESQAQPRVSHSKRFAKKALCFGLEPYPLPGYGIDHCPLIETHPLPFEIKEASYLLFTSKTAVDLCPRTEMPVIAIGKGTAARAKQKGFHVVEVSANETQEGICSLVDRLHPTSLFWPRSDRARTVLENYCQEKGIALFAPPAYSISFKKIQLPQLSDYQALFFTSPSTVEAFFALNPQLPPAIELIVMGVVTEKYLIDRVSLFKGTYSATLFSRLPTS